MALILKKVFVASCGVLAMLKFFQEVPSNFMKATPPPLALAEHHRFPELSTAKSETELVPGPGGKTKLAVDPTVNSPLDVAATAITSE